jgi:Ras family protein T1
MAMIYRCDMTFYFLRKFSSPLSPMKLFILTIGVALSFDVPVDCSVELSPDGYQFFAELLQAFDKVSYLKEQSLTGVDFDFIG